MRGAPSPSGAARTGNREGAGAHPFPPGRPSKPPDAAAGAGRTRGVRPPPTRSACGPRAPREPAPSPARRERKATPKTPARETRRARGCPGAGTGPQSAQGCLRGGGEPPGTAPVWDRSGGAPEGGSPGWKKPGLWGPCSCPRSR
ncbi:cuticle collagen 7-like [Enhydra lutris kenyoni]|uniref:Cuticle collagen 7-like n=1 Tax=Enhydra lutris kenyoni TaxID=391180 RepID=A0A2Y9LFX7_ENHLU|nr:cuticle collagen 7-like [Enhydra lutris kenyoni]